VNRRRFLVRALFFIAASEGGCVAFESGSASSSSSSSSSSSAGGAPPSSVVDGSAPDADAGKELDASTDAEGAAPLPYAHAPCNGAANCPRYVFVTSEAFTGDLRIAGVNGTSSGDEHCTRLANAGGAPLAGRLFKAWLSSDEDPVLTVAAVRLVHGVEPYILPDGRIVAASWTKLTTNNLDVPIDLTELGVAISPSPVWTGSLESGALRSPTCSNWQVATTGNGWTGNTSRVNGKWTNDVQQACSQLARLYCIER